MHANDTDPERRVARAEVVGLVHAALDRLPPHYAQALEWKYLEGATMKEISARIDSTPKAVESLLTRARNAYRDALSALLAGLLPQPARGPSQ
jgi:RNA polymerase sigma factor (sigma-70 family)